MALVLHDSRVFLSCGNLIVICGFRKGLHHQQHTRMSQVSTRGGRSRANADFLSDSIHCVRDKLTFFVNSSSMRS